MPFLKRGKARARQNIPNPPPVVVPPPPPEETPPTTQLSETVEETTVPKQEVTYRVPKEERLLDLPLEEEVFGEEAETELSEISETYNIMPVGDPVSIGAVLKKKKKR